MKEQEKTLTQDTDFIDDAQNQVKDWVEDFDQLQEKIKSAGSDIEKKYSEQIADLQSKLNDVEERFDDLRSSDSENWEERRYDFQRASWVYQQSYGTTIQDMKAMENEPLGWLEGFTDRPPAGSAGWLEGTDTEAEGSEGWVEGMAEKGPKSEGWTEGFDTKEKAN
jgi:hypothetical protein